MMKKHSIKQYICLILMVILALSFILTIFRMQRPATPNIITQASKKSSSESSPQATSAVSIPQGSYVEITFNFNRSSNKKGSDQFAAWIEDSNGKFVRTLVVTQYAARKGAAKYTFCLPTWSERSGARANSQEIDTAAGATPKTGTIHYYWDLTDKNNTPVKPGIYHLYLEGTQSETDQLLFQGNINVGGQSAAITAAPTYKSGKAPDTPMLSAVTFLYKP